MKKKFSHLLNNNNKIFKTLLFLVLISYSYNSFKLNHYETLFMDEKLLIDDIYNIWLVDDVYQNFSNIENIYLRKFLIILYEIVYGGDLRYGKLWSNFFSLFIGIFTIFSDTVVITATRLLNVIIHYCALLILVKTYVSKKYRWLSMLLLISVPGTETLLRLPKPDTFALLLLSVGLYYFYNKKNLRCIFFLSLSIFVKLNFLIVSGIFILMILYNSKSRWMDFFKTVSIVTASLFIVNPVLLIPPISFGNIDLPNFFKVYINWITSQSSYGQEDIFSFEYFIMWSETLGIFYRFPESILFVFTAFIIIGSVFLIKYAFKINDIYSITFSSIAMIYLTFYFFFVERQFVWYLNLPFILIVISIIRFLEKSDSINLKSSLMSIILPMLIVGNVVNISSNFDNKRFAAPSGFGYEDIGSEESAIYLVYEVLSEIEILIDNGIIDSSTIVLWNPELFAPRNGVTYDSTFYVRENWNSDELGLLGENYQLIVTYKNFENILFNKIQVGNFFLYFNE